MPLNKGFRSVLVLLSLLWFSKSLECSRQKPISVLRIVAYSIISMLDYYKDTRANVRLSESWLIWGSNCVTQIERKFVKRESNRIKNLSQIQSKTVSQIKSNKVSKIKSNTAKRTKSATTASAELPKSMMVLASYTWHHNGKAVNAVAEWSQWL